MATGASGKDMSKGNTNQGGAEKHGTTNDGGGSPRIQGTWSRKHNTGGKDKVNSKRITVS